MSVVLISLKDHWASGNRSLQAFLNRDGIEASLVFFQTIDSIFIPPPREAFDELIRLLKDLKPELVGISVRTQFWWIAVRMVRRIKKELEIPVILGGAHVTLNPDEAIQIADLICVGEGEAALPELIKRLRKGESINDIPNIWARLSNGEVIRNSPKLAVNNLDDIPPPIINRSYLINLNGERVCCDPLFDNLQLVEYLTSASRGCPFVCSYCCESIVKDMYGNPPHYIRHRSIEHLFNELKFIKGRFPRLREIYFLDEVFHHSQKWMDEFCIRYKKEINLPFTVMIHPSLINPNLIESLKKAGVPFSINFGVQSGSERVRKEIFARPVSDKVLNRVIDLLNDNPSIFLWVDIIVDNPFETPEEFRQTVLTILKIKRRFMLQHFSLTFYAGIPITERALKSGYARKENLPGYTEDRIDMWVPKLEDPSGNPLKTYLKIIVHMHQFKMLSLFNPNKISYPFPLWLLTILAKRKKVSNLEVKLFKHAYIGMSKIPFLVYLWRGRIQYGRRLIRERKTLEFVRGLTGVLLRFGRLKKSP